jgi:2-polyprenyl-3-methyl-5-hydroxy-6-metoxy-1,4-benzoquinol methylase
LNYVRKLGDNIWSETRKSLLDFIGIDKTAVFLDLGCNDGDLTLLIANKLGTSRVHGVDIVDDLLLKSREKGIQVYKCDLNQKLPFVDCFFDVITANQVWEHVSDTDLFTREIIRILKPGGYALISTPNLAAWHNIFSLILGWQPPTAHLSDEVYLGNPFGIQPEFSVEKTKAFYHRRIPTYRGIRELFIYHGFQVIGLRGIGYTPFSSRWLSKFLARLDVRHSSSLLIKVKKPE